jgi:hypothetical protein
VKNFVLLYQKAYYKSVNLKKNQLLSFNNNKEDKISFLKG